MSPDPSRATTRRLHASRGQSLAEFALVFPILMLILGAIIQFGILFWGQNTLNQIARDTGRWAATQQDCNPATATAPVVATANAIAAQSSLIGYSGGWTSPTDVTVTWTGSPCPPLTNQTQAWVRIAITHTVPTFFPFVPGGGVIGTSTEYRMEPKPE